MSEARSPDPKQWAEASRWLKYADDDLRVAELAITQVNLTAIAAFHCQQAGEKMAKAVLIALGYEYPKIHDIAELARLVGTHVANLGTEIGQLAGLTDWYVTSRYPAAEFEPARQEIVTALEKLKELRRSVARLAPESE